MGLGIGLKETFAVYVWSQLIVFLFASALESDVEVAYDVIGVYPKLYVPTFARKDPCGFPRRICHGARTPLSGVCLRTRRRG